MGYMGYMGYKLKKNATAKTNKQHNTSNALEISMRNESDRKMGDRKISEGAGSSPGL
jgi:hypothetical protein